MMKYANAILYVRKQFQCSYFSAASLQKALHCHPNVLFKSTNTHFFFLLPLPFSFSLFILKDLFFNSTQLFSSQFQIFVTL